MSFINIFKKKKPRAADSASRAVAKAKRTSFSSLPSLLLRKSSVGEEEDLSSSPSGALATGEEESLLSSPSRAKGTLTRKAAMADEKEKPKRMVEEKKIEEKKEVEKESPKLKSKNIRSSSPFAAARVKEVRFGQSYKILKGPHITEKAGDLAEKNQYVFKIFPRANKIGVKKAIEDTYGVDVVSIKIINVPKKKRRLGKIQGTRPGYKKAIVKIKKGQKIEVLPR